MRSAAGPHPGTIRAVCRSCGLKIAKSAMMRRWYITDVLG
jgi:hypothetical protein